MRAGIAVLVALTWFLPGLARAQPDTASAGSADAIPLHPDIMTVLQLPEDIVRARTLHRKAFRVGFFKSRIYVQPRPDTPAGTEALLEVETRTQQRRFRLRVVEHAGDATQFFLVRAPEAEQATSDARPVPLPEVMPSPSLPVTPPPSLPVTPPPGLPDSGQVSMPEPAAPIHACAMPASLGQPLVLSLHAIVTLAGATAVGIAGYEPDDARQSHRAFGMRLAAAPRDDRWSLEGSISGEWPAAPMRYSKPDQPPRREVLTVSGPSLLVEVGMRTRFGTTLMATAYAGAGLQAHFREMESIIEDSTLPDEALRAAERSEDMPLGGVLGFGLGLDYRAGNVLLGLELRLRQGVPADYRSVEAFLSVGIHVDQGE